MPRAVLATPNAALCKLVMGAHVPESSSPLQNFNQTCQQYRVVGLEC